MFLRVFRDFRTEDLRVYEGLRVLKGLRVYRVLICALDVFRGF